MSFNIYHEHQNAIFFQFTNKLIMFWGQTDNTWGCDLYDSTEGYEDGQWKGSIYTNVLCNDEPTAQHIADAITGRVNQYQKFWQMYDFLVKVLNKKEIKIIEKSRANIDECLEQIECRFFNDLPDDLPYKEKLAIKSNPMDFDAALSSLSTCLINEGLITDFNQDCQTTAQTNNQEEKFFFFRYEIRDGEHEYLMRGLTKSVSEVKALKAISDDYLGSAYEGDYRLSRLNGIEEINKETFDILSRYL